MTTKVGRNDPCPCGSGKKYKKCCMVLAEIIDPADNLFTRYNKLFSLIKVKLDGAYSREIKKVRHEAGQLFLRYTSEHTLKKEYEPFLSDWIWFDKTDSDENTFAFHYLNTHGQFMDPSLKLCLSGLIFSYLSVYEVLGMDNELLSIQDIFTKEKAKVLIAESFDSSGNPLLLGRLVHMPEASLFSGMVLVMPNEPERKEFLIEHFNYIREVSQLPVPDLFKFNGNMIFGLFEHAYKKVFVNLNDIRYTSITAENKDQLISNLRNNENFKELYELEGYTWFKPLDRNRGYIRIAISDENAVTCADVLEDVNYLQETVKASLPDSNFTVINSTFLNQPPELNSADIWFTMIKDQESERWFNSSMKELEGKSPLELLKEEEGKNRLLEKLKELEHTLETEEQKEFLAYLKMKLDKIITD